MLLVLWPTLLSDSPFGWRKRSKEIWAFLTKLLNDPFDLVRQYDELNDAFWESMRHTEDGRAVVLPLHDRFKNTPIFEEYNRWFIHMDPNLAAYISTFLTFCKKLEWDAPELEASALRAWFANEERLEKVVWDKKLLGELRGILQALTADWDEFSFAPRHGNGAVSQSLGRLGLEPDVVTKNWYLHLPPKVRFAYMERGIRSTQGVLDPTCMRGIHLSARDVLDCEVGGDFFTEQRSRLMFVPKTYKALRSICKEPIALQWAQQGVLRWMSANMSKGLISQFVKLEAQSFNRDKARLGSITLSLDTIDLSSASDLVAWALVKGIMPAKVLYHLAATRSCLVNIGKGMDVKVHKFAPMGSALCFPVQTLVYLSVVVWAYLKYYSADLSYFMELPLDARRDEIRRVTLKSDLMGPAIYGDDIVCDSYTTSTVVTILKGLGFLLNEQKSFTGLAGFRESCGGFYAYGHDVSPYRLKFEPFSDAIEPEVLPSLVDAINEMHRLHLHHTANALTQVVLYSELVGVRKEKGVNPILFTTPNSDEALAIWSNNPHNHHLSKRMYNPELCGKVRATCHDYQRDEMRSISIGPTVTYGIPKDQDWYRHMVWWGSRLDEIGKPHAAYSKQQTLVNSFLYEGDMRLVESIIEDARKDTLPMKSVSHATDFGWRWTPI
jgi:hypothetical protein